MRYQPNSISAHTALTLCINATEKSIASCFLREVLCLKQHHPVETFHHRQLNFRKHYAVLTTARQLNTVFSNNMCNGQMKDNKIKTNKQNFNEAS